MRYRKCAGSMGQATMSVHWPLFYANESLMPRSPIVFRKKLLPLLLSGLLIAWHAGATDSRQVFSDDAPVWLRAVGKLQVPGQRHRNGYTSHYLEDCSATLVARTGQNQADTIITAWHCLELYNDLSKPITFTGTTVSGEQVQREALHLMDGGGMHADWAILRLRRAVKANQITALTIHPQIADPDRPVTMAGYSGDSGIGDDGQALTFDPACAISNQTRAFGDTNCTAHKGASGGAVIQLSGTTGEPQVCGVISQGNGEGRSTFVPVSGFRNAINLALQ
jgi:hypothetical protein